MNQRMTEEAQDPAQAEMKAAAGEVPLLSRRQWALLAGVGQLLLAGGQGLVDGFTLGSNVGQEIFLLGKAAFQFFELGEQARQGFVTFLGAVGKVQCVFHGLAK